jgi:hypothetical protein
MAGGPDGLKSSGKLLVEFSETDEKRKSRPAFQGAAREARRDGTRPLRQLANPPTAKPRSHGQSRAFCLFLASQNLSSGGENHFRRETSNTYNITTALSRGLFEGFPPSPRLKTRIR